MSRDRGIADAVVIGSGPNGLVAAIALARAGWDVVVLERAAVAGGGVRSEELTLPGYVHDTFSAFYGLLQATPVFTELKLDQRVAWTHFDAPVAACVSPESAAILYRDAERTAKGLAAHDASDADAWRDMVRWWENVGRRFFDLTLSPVGSIRPALRFARGTGIRGFLPNIRTLLTPLDQVARDRFRSAAGQALFACGITHADLSVESTGSTPAGIILAMLGQFEGFPVATGGAGKLASALLSILDEHGGVVHTGDAVAEVILEGGRARAVRTEAGRIVRARHAVIADTSVVSLTRDLVGEEAFPQRWLDGIRSYRYPTGVFKIDLALDGPTPWLVDELRSTGVVHVTGTLDDMARANFEARHAQLPARPSLVIGQQSIGDPTRAPAGGHTLWIETHVPPHPVDDGAGTLRSVDGWDSVRTAFSDRVIDLIEEHAPGLRARILGSAVHTPRDLEAANPNLVDGDISGGSMALHQQLVFRPVPNWFRYRTPVKGLYLCSAAAHPGGGVHGMGGWNCAKRVRRDAWKPSGIVRTAGGGRRSPRG